MCVTHDKTEKLKKVLNSSAGLLFSFFQRQGNKEWQRKNWYFYKRFQKIFKFYEIVFVEKQFCSQPKGDTQRR